MAKTSRTVFYLGAHQDDWQLFMTPQAHRDLTAARTRVVFVYLTAGDAGIEASWRRGRTAGALGSVQFATRQRIEAPVPERAEANGHPVALYPIAHTRSYFLDLPDGNVDGGGFPATGRQSLQRLRAGALPALETQADSPAFATRYVSWQDLTATLRALLEREGPGEVHLLDPQGARHADHRDTGLLARDAIGDAAGYPQAFYEDYAIAERPPNVEGLDLAWKAGLYFAYAQAAFERSGQTHPFDDLHLSFLTRQYRTR